jgi:hypothetical protein
MSIDVHQLIAGGADDGAAATGWLRHDWPRAIAASSGWRPARRRASWWREWHHELRRHAGNDRLPAALRVGLRERARRALARATAAGAEPPYPRRWLRDQPAVALPASWRAGASAARAAGIPGDRPIVALEATRRPQVLTGAIEWLISMGYVVVRVGDGDTRLARRDGPGTGLIDLSHVRLRQADREHSGERSRALELEVLAAARFVVCESHDLQQLAGLIDTPALLLHGRDPFSAYPVRGNGVFTLATAVDLDTGGRYQPGQLLEEECLRNRRAHGYMPTSVADVLAAVQEMHDGVERGFSDLPSQQQFRDRVVAAGQSLASRLAFVTAWGPDAGFIGDGRLAWAQAERLHA